MLQTPRPSVSYGGCGFFGGFYQIGNTAALREFAPYLLQGDILGSSSGSLLAVVIAAGLSIEELTRITIQNSTKVAEKFLGPVTPGFYLNEEIKKAYEDLLPEDIAERISGRLHFSMTKVPQFSNIVVNQFTTKSDVIDALCCTAFIPWVSGWFPPKFRGDYYIDGFYSNNQPILNKETITMTAFAGNTSICPQDGIGWSKLIDLHFKQGPDFYTNVTWNNILRIPNIGVPPATETCMNACKRGYDDAIKYLYANKLIRCEHPEECLTTKLPAGIIKVFEEEIEKESSTEHALSTKISRFPISMWQKAFRCEV